MKSRQVSIFKSFQFKIVLYTFLSLIFTAMTEGALIFLIKVVQSGTGTYEGAGYNIQGKNGIPQNGGEGLYNNGAYASSKEAVMGHRPMGGFIIFVLILIGLVLFVVYFLLLTRNFTIYLDEIVVGINKMATGDLTTRIHIDDEDEFAFIGNRLNAMADDIRYLMESERKSEKIKNDLITNVAHDLRTPLTSVIGYLDLVLRDENLEAQLRQKYIGVAYDKAIRLEKLIEDLFNFTKYNSEEVVLKLVPLDVVKLMEQMVEEFYPAFQDANLYCEFQPCKEPAIVMADGDFLARAFSNLISNAIKYGRDGKNIRIHVHQNEAEVLISITNYGEVISEENLLHVFDRFYRVESSRNAETGGTGLGLAIAKKVVLMHGGTIKVTSSMDGTVFRIVLKKGEAHEEK